MKVLGRVGMLALAAVAAGSLTGCEVKAQYGAQCTTSPPVPHQNNGVVEVDVEVPPEVRPGETFTVRVDDMVGYPAFQTPSAWRTGTVSATGPVAPSGRFGVGQGPFGGSPYPHTLEFTATGQPGEEIVLGAESGSSFIGTFPNGYFATCGTGGARIATIRIVAPPEGA